MNKPIIILQEKREEDGITICDTGCTFYDSEYHDGCMIFNVIWDDYDYRPQNCPGPGEYKLCQK